MLASLAAPLAAVLLAAPDDRQNALAFDSGAVLVEDSGAYRGARGALRWSAWHLADGDERQGWRSPDGVPAGGGFVWELDATWHLEAVVLSTRHLEELAFPGISARTVELFVVDGPTLRRLGTFTVGKEERREHPLPPGTTARRVRAVVTDNWGHPRLTELAEIELLGTRQGKPRTPPFTGDFATHRGAIRIATEGSAVIGCYDWAPGAAIEGVVEGRVARVTWSEPGARGGRSGTATLGVTADGDALRGVWYEHGEAQGDWAGPRARAGEEARCTPRRRPALAAAREPGGP